MALFQNYGGLFCVIGEIGYVELYTGDTQVLMLAPGAQPFIVVIDSAARGLSALLPCLFWIKLTQTCFHLDNKADNIGIKNKLEQQSFKISPFKEVIKRTKPHKHDAYFEIIFLSEGAGFHWIDTQKFQINPPVVYFLSGQLHYWEMTAIPKGFVLLFKEDFFDFFKQGELLNLIRSLEGTVTINCRIRQILISYFLKW